MLSIAVALSVAGLLVGPALVAWTRGTPLALAALDGALLGIVPALVLLRLLPHLVEETGGLAIVAFSAGFLAFWLLEARMHGRATRVGLSIVLPILALHGFLDGTGLALAFEGAELLGTGSWAIGVALVVHKVPEGLFVAALSLPDGGTRKTSLRLAVLALATVLGALGGRELLASTPDRILHLMVALGLGVLLRMAVHRHQAPPQTPSERLASGLVFLICLGALIAIPDPESMLTSAQQGELTALETLAPLLLETAPWLLFALLLGELRARRSRTANAGGPMWLPMIALSLPLLGVVPVLVRAVAEPICAARDLAPGSRERARAWIALALPTARYVLPSYAVGVGVAVAVEAAAPQHALQSLGWSAVAGALPLALVARIGAAGFTVLIAVLIHKGLPLPLAMLCTCLAAHTLRASAGAVRRTLAAAGGAMAVMFALAPTVPPLHDLAAHEHPWLEWLCAALIAAWSFVQLALLGPRAWFPAPEPVREEERLTPPPGTGTSFHHSMK